MSHRSVLLSLFLMIVFSVKTIAQDVNAQVEVMHNRVTGIDKAHFEKLKTNIIEFINNRKWTSDVYSPHEKINCNFLINITEIVGDIKDNTFKGTITIQANRPVYNSTYTTQTFNFLDKELAFKYEMGQSLIFDENRVAGTDPMTANLPAVLAYYINLILGFDYDSFSPMGGEIYFKKAQHIVTNAPEEARLINGWSNQDGQRNNRYWIVEQILNQRFTDLRMFWYDYHINGLDKMHNAPDIACQMIYSHFDKLKKVFKENVSSIFFTLIFTAKSQELVQMLPTFDASYRKEAVATLIEIDPLNASRYRNVK